LQIAIFRNRKGGQRNREKGRKGGQVQLIEMKKEIGEIFLQHDKGSIKILCKR